MINRFYTATSTFARRGASQSAAWAMFVRDMASGFLTTAHHTLMVLGLVAIGALSILFVKPELADRVKSLSPFANAAPADVSARPYTLAAGTTVHQPSNGRTEAAAVREVDARHASTSRQQQWVTDWLSKRYRVAADATDMLVSAAYATAKEMKLDPLLILSVMAIESGFNPFAESPVGAQGLMQVMSKVHHDKFQDHGGVKAALNPAANIRVGSQILKEYVTRGGSVEAGLKMYVGAGAFDSDSGYGAKVLAEYRRLKDVAMGKKVPVTATSVTSAAVKPRPQERKAESTNDSESASSESADATDQMAAL
ncbi:MAG: lytic transglycosylase protein [Noviherbaspirillum sp.]|nr:lytic transglycosylase protein [Noviherbaspirillum sp.]